MRVTDKQVVGRCKPVDVASVVRLLSRTQVREQTNKINTMYAILVFRTQNAREFVVEREFASEQHMNNFIAHIKRKFGYILDEVYK